MPFSSLYLNIRKPFAGSEQVLENYSWGSWKVLEKSWIYLSVKEWEPSTLSNVPGVFQKKRYPCFNFAITSVNVHRF